MTRYKRARLACAVLSIVAFLGVAGCGRGGVQAGHALRTDPPTSIGDKPLAPGFEIGLLDAFVDNASDSTLVIDSVGISGHGIGTVVRPVQVEMAPLRFGRRTYEMTAAPAATYETDPPVLFYGHRCHRQALFPVKGYRMTPGSQTRIWIVVRAIRPGKWDISPVVHYTAGGVRYRQAVPVRQYGSVADHAAYIPPDSATVKCVGPQTGATFLPGFHAGRISH